MSVVRERRRILVEKRSCQGGDVSANTGRFRSAIAGACSLHGFTERVPRSEKTARSYEEEAVGEKRGSSLSPEERPVALAPACHLVEKEA